jgi:hypothetical protein
MELFCNMILYFWRCLMKVMHIQCTSISCNKQKATQLPWVTFCGAWAEKIGMIFRQLLHGHCAMPQSVGHQSLAAEGFFIPVTLGHVFLLFSAVIMIWSLNHVYSCTASDVLSNIMSIFK